MSKWKWKTAAALLGTTAMISMSPFTVFAHVNESAAAAESGTEAAIEVPEEAADEGTDKSREAAEEPQGPLTPDGNMTLVDDYGSPAKFGKQFITMISKNGNYFYLIIDRDDSGNETVHFLNQVDESDLLALMDEDEVKKYAASKEGEEKEEEEKKPVVTEETNPVENSAAQTAETDKEEKTKKGFHVPVGTLVLLFLIGVGAIGGYVYKKVGKQNRKTTEPDPDADYTESEDEDYLKELEDEKDHTGIDFEREDSAEDFDVGEDSD
ncbi:protein of unknown function [Lachnospiraceae bacterium NK3A20]|nr:protein of unknown function [Lachnospiraceae bacterium NK3A20]